MMRMAMQTDRLLLELLAVQLLHRLVAWHAMHQHEHIRIISVCNEYVEMRKSKDWLGGFGSGDCIAGSERIVSSPTLTLGPLKGRHLGITSTCRCSDPSVHLCFYHLFLLLYISPATFLGHLIDMVSLLSLFGGKKKPKKAGASGPSSSAASSASTGRRRSRSPPPTQASAASAVTPRPVLTTHKSGSSSSGNKLNAFASSAGNNGTAKFLSLRSKSSGGVSLLSKGRSKAIAGDASPTKETPAWELPSFGFGDKGDDLGLSNVGGLPKITEQEWQVVQDVRFGMTEINAAWRLIGEGLRIARKCVDFVL